MRWLAIAKNAAPRVAGDHLSKPVERIHFLKTVRAHLPPAVKDADKSRSPLKSTATDPDLPGFIPLFLETLAEQVEQVMSATRLADVEALKSVLHQIKGSSLPGLVIVTSFFKRLDWV